MKGIVFNLLESFICEYWGQDTYEEVLGQCPLKTKEPFIGPGTYPDTDLILLAEKTADKLGVSLADALRDFGRFCFPHMIRKIKNLEVEQMSAKEFLLIVNDLVHLEVKKFYQNADVPHFIYHDNKNDELLIEYHSKRQLCAFMEGLLDGVAEEFNTPMRFHQTQCVHVGHDHCLFNISFGERHD